MLLSESSGKRFARKLVASALGLAMFAGAQANNLTAGPVVTGTDFQMFGVSGLRGNASGGTINVAGITGTVTRAILVWHGVSTSATAITRSASINATSVSGSNIGLSSDNCWSQASSQAFQADVTPIVTGNGAYALTNMIGTGTFDPNGASLLVFYNDGNSTNNRDVAVFWGNDSNQTNTFDAAGWNATLNGINYSSGAASLQLIVSDGQDFGETGSNTINLNTTAVTLPRFQGASLPVSPGSSQTSGGLWDHANASITSVLSPGLNNLTLSGNPEGLNDCLSLISTVFDLPAGAIVVQPQATNAAVPVASPLISGVMGGALALWGVYALRRRERKA
jgi:hypothetical protein